LGTNHPKVLGAGVRVFGLVDGVCGHNKKRMHVIKSPKVAISSPTG